MKLRMLVVALVAATLLVAAAPEAALAKPPRMPVVLVIFDELPVNSLLARDGRIDRVRYPHFAKLADGATWYANATTASDASKFAIPSVLDGRAPRHVAPSAKAHPGNLFTLLHAQGYRMRVEEEATDLCPYPECKRRFGARYFLASDRVARFRKWISTIEDSPRPTLYYKHTLLPHVPWLYLPSGQRYNRNVLGPITGLNSSELSVFDPTLVRQSWQRHLLQAGTADLLLGELMDKLKATHLYDRSMLVVMSDHGVSFRRGATDRRTIVRANALDIAPTPLFVKDPGQADARVSGRLVRTYDVLPTIAAKIGLRLPRGLIGRPAPSRAVRRRKSVTILSRSKIGHITLSRRQLRRLKRRALRRKIALFGSGSRTLFDFGPNRRLRGRGVSKLRVVEGGPVRARINEEDAYVTIRPDAAFLPIQVTGRIRGGPAGSRRDIAVALNGVIRGVTRSVRLRGKRAEYFSVLVDPRGLVKGNNQVEVLAISRRRGRYGLRRIYGKAFKPPKKPTKPPPVVYPGPPGG